MSGDANSVENIIDLWIDSSSGPHKPTTDAEIDQLRKSGYFVHGNYYQLAALGPNISHDGLIRMEKNGNGFAPLQRKAEALRRVHNYLSSVYSYNMQVIDHVNEKMTDERYNKHNLLPGRETPRHKIPKYVRKNCFLHGLRNDMQHGEYQCLRVEKEDENEDYEFYHLRFIKSNFKPRPTGGLEKSGDYLRYSTEQEREYPLTYICDFHKEFNKFEQDLEGWCKRSRA